MVPSLNYSPQLLLGWEANVTPAAGNVILECDQEGSEQRGTSVVAEKETKQINWPSNHEAHLRKMSSATPVIFS